MLSFERDLSRAAEIPLPQVVEKLCETYRAWDDDDWADIRAESHTPAPWLEMQLRHYEPDATSTTAHTLMQGMRLLTMGEGQSEPYSDGIAGLNAVYEARLQGLAGDGLLDYVAQSFSPRGYAFVLRHQGMDNIETLTDRRQSMQALVALSAILDRHEEVLRAAGELPPVLPQDPTAIV